MCSGNVGNKCSEEIVKFSTDDKPESIFVYLFLEPSKLSRTSSEKCSVFFHRIRMPIPPHEIPQSIAEAGSGHREECCERKYIPLSSHKKSTNQNHEIHTRDDHANKWERFYHGYEKKYDIIPLSPRFDLHSHPVNNISHDIRPKER